MTKRKTKAATRKSAGERRKSASVLALSRGDAANARMIDAMGLEERGHPLTVHAAKNDATTIDVYDVIGGYNVNAKMFRQHLNSIKSSKIVVRINSPGGLVFDGIAMYNDLVAHPARVEVEISGLAASAASILAMAGDFIDIADSAHMMIHNAWVVNIGDRHELRKLADVLEGIDGSLARVYAARTGLPIGEVADMMDEETWLDAPRAVELGFADAAGDVVPANASRFDLSCYVKTPELLKVPAKGTTPATPAAVSEDLSQQLAAVARFTELVKGSVYVGSQHAHDSPVQSAAS